MVGTLANVACVASEPNGVEHHNVMKPLSWDNKQLGLASPQQSAASQKRPTNHPCENERAGCKSPHLHLSEGRGEVFFLDILFYRMSDIAIFHQLTRNSARHENILSMKGGDEP